MGERGNGGLGKWGNEEWGNEPGKKMGEMGKWADTNCGAEAMLVEGRCR